MDSSKAAVDKTKRGPGRPRSLVHVVRPVRPLRSAQPRRNGGFTLLEMMLVVIIIGVLVAMVVPRLTGRSEQARVAAARADIEANIAVALDLYELDNGGYPTSEQGIEALLEKPSIPPVPPNWSGPYLKKRLPKDPWGEPYVYRSPGMNNTYDYDLFSKGPDQIEGNVDDIVNWSE